MITALIIIGFAFWFGLFVGLVAGLQWQKWIVLTYRKAAETWRREAESEKKRADLTKTWADATIQNIADAAADYGLQLQLDNMPIGPRPEAKEWPAIIGEDK